MPGLTFDLATEDDDAALRRLLRQNPMPGAIALSFEREPRYSRAAGVEGPFHQAVVGRSQAGGEIVIMGSRAVRPMFVNGRAQPVGYLSQLRVDQRREWGLTLARRLAPIWQAIRRLHADGRAPFYLMSVVADNARARRLFAVRVPGFPEVREVARLHTYAIAPARARRPLAPPRGLRLERGSPARTSAIVECLQRNGARRQFYPCWSADTLFNPEHTPDLNPADFLLALDGERVVGCLALWDQTGFKQTVVRGYAGHLRRWRRLLSGLAQTAGLPALPPVNTELCHAYASHLAVDDDDPAVFAALLRGIYNQAAVRRYHSILLGLSPADPLGPVLTRGYPHLTYQSQLYLVSWEDGRAAAAQVNGMLPGPEIAVL